MITFLLAWIGSILTGISYQVYMLRHELADRAKGSS